jgi:hypothetical protein
LITSKTAFVKIKVHPGYQSPSRGVKGLRAIITLKQGDGVRENPVMAHVSAAARIEEEVASWPGVHVEGHRGGIVFFRVDRREIGHLHGSRFADLPFPVRIREQLVGEGKAELHYLHPKTGWITRYIRDEQDIEAIIELFRLNYHRPWLHR